MRILNRPMFKYGGPIKEGVMHGMRNNYQSGQLVRPGPGRPGYQGPPKNLSKTKWGAWLATKLPWWSKIKTATKDIIPKTIEKGKQLTLPGMEGTGGLGGSSAGQQFLKNLKSFPGASKIPGWATKAKDIAFKYPKSTAAGTLYGAKPLYELATGPGKKLVETAADVAVPDWIYNWETGRWFNPDDTDLPPGDKKILEEKKTIGSGAQFKESTAPELTASQRDKLAKDAQNKRMKSYLDMMGYDSAKKTALSDALIDASAIVQQGTEEAGSLKEADWGKLINQAIQTTSRRLDKPEQIREAVGLMATKGAIEKDILEAKGSPQRQVARDLVAAGVYKTEKEALSKLANVGSFEETMAGLTAKTGKVTGDNLKLSWIMDPANTTNTPPRDHFKSTDEVYKKFKEKMEDAGNNYNIELEFVKQKIDDRQPGDAYVIDDTLVIVKSDGSLDYKWK